ncbi:relaxase/mobilization nuclease domain-containing protein, partial [Acinetobacter pseudolwoffii]|uniref:relaxase/mobilization nuclease domain-containing protein n=1 Tax=Acinetobacter pseudolwoffii TaxID=2053287 RepID=UPI00209ADF7A
MIVKFLGNKGGGSAAATIDYLLGEDRDRPGAILLSGDPELTQRLADNLDFQNRYTVGVLSFEESDLEKHQKEAIMQSFEETLLAGLERDQYDITWIEHTDKGRLELNFVIPNVELSTGKRLQPYFDQADRPLVENWKQVTNFEHGLTDPHAPEKAQAIKTLNSQNLPQSV